MNRQKIVIHKEDEIERLVDQIGEAVLYQEAMEVNQINEVSDYITHRDDKVKYHFHVHGTELFVITKGSVDAILGGRQCKADEGDMLLVKPFMPHAFKYLEEGTTWQEIIQKLSLFEQERGWARIVKNCPEKLEDADFMHQFKLHNGRVDYAEINALETERVPKSAMTGLVAKGEYYKKYSFAGIDCMLKYPRWELEGVKEVWEFRLDKDVRIDWADHYYDSELFAVRQGSVKVEVQDYEDKIAAAGDVISIPNYTAHSITALEPDTIIQDFNCRSQLFLMLENISISKNTGVLQADHDSLKNLFNRYEIPVTGISGIY